MQYDVEVIIMKKLNETFKEFIVGKKAKLTIYILGVLWISVIMQLAVNTFLRPNHNILDAFINTNPEVSSSELEVAADYGKGYLSEADRRDLILYIASEIGLQVNDDVVTNRKGNDCEVYIEKKNKNAETLIKLVSVELENSNGIAEINHYILVRLTIYENMDSLLGYRDLIKDIFKNLNVKNIQTNMQVNGNYKGKLTLDEMNEIANSMVTNLQGKIAYANRQDDLYTIYAYSGLLDEYVNSIGNKINIHIAIDYDEDTDSTKILLGTPVINGGY